MAEGNQKLGMAEKIASNAGLFPQASTCPNVDGSLLACRAAAPIKIIVERRRGWSIDGDDSQNSGEAMQPSLVEAVGSMGLKGNS
jgi:hypothetical protein